MPALVSFSDAVSDPVRPRRESRGRVEENTTVLAVERDDLNRDPSEDAVLVLEPEDPEQPKALFWVEREILADDYGGVVVVGSVVVAGSIWTSRR